jgi:hypothetical protein
MISFSFVLGLSSALIAIVIFTLISHYLDEKKFVYIHSSGVAILIGVTYSKVRELISPDYQKQQFYEGIIFLGLLPPMIFNEGFSIKSGIFINNLTKIFILGILIFN